MTPDEQVFTLIDDIERSGQYSVLGRGLHIDDLAIVRDKIKNIYYDNYTLEGFFNKFFSACKPFKRRFENIADVQKWLDRKFGPNEFKILSGDFTNMYSFVTVRHSCGHIYPITLYGLTDKRKKKSVCSGCCSNGKSNGEQRIEKYLQSRNILYKPQYRDNRCRDMLALPFDFAVLKSPKIIHSFIEFDGIQHFQPVEKFGGEEGFYKTLEHDAIKDLFCRNYKYKLIRIPYYKVNDIENILDRELAC